MNNKLIFLLSVGITAICSSCVFDDLESPEPEEVYVKYYGSNGSQYLSDMVINDQANVVMLGGQELSQAGANWNCLLIEADNVGNEINTVDIDVARDILGIAQVTGDSSVYATEEVPESIKLIDGGYLIVGTFNQVIDGSPQESKIFWARLDQDFGIIIADTIGAGTDNVTGKDIMQTNDGNIVVVGMTDHPEENDLTVNPENQYFLIKKLLSNPDSTIWRKSYGYPSSNDEVFACYELGDGSIAVLGSTEQLGDGGARGKNVGVMVVNSLASSQTSDEIFGVEINGDNASDDIPYDAIAISGGFVVVGTSTLGEVIRPFVIGVRESGALIFNTPIDSRWGINAHGYGVVQSNSGDLVVTGKYPEFSVAVGEAGYQGLIPEKQDEVMFIRTSETGIPKADFENNFGLRSGDDIGEVVLKFPNGAIAIGATIDFGSNQNMIALMKVNDQGSLQRQ
ncbi:MAG: hypothetical protein JXQ90_23990 [Cyclobacteriaceae bacterium]